MNLKNLYKLYNYNLPKELIAQKPASPRDNSRLLVYNRSCNTGYCMNFDKFFNLDKYLPKNAVLVFNETKVLPARLEVFKESGGRVKILYIGEKVENKNKFYEFLSDRKLNIDQKLFIGKKEIFKVVGKNENKYLLKLLLYKRCGRRFCVTDDIFNLLEKFGTMPIPPYIKYSPLSEKELKEKYQTIFAKNKGSVAAPTASLHFTKQVFAKLKAKKIDCKFLTLHVNLGTFAPLTQKNLQTKKLHQEFYFIDKKTVDFLNKSKKQGKKIIAVGTTALRALESATVKNKIIPRQNATTQLFIDENYKSKFVDGLITNFHVPKSSLLMLVAAMIGRKKLLEIYKIAIENKFRFYSFGDGMLIL